MKVELSWDEREFLRELLDDEKKGISRGEVFYPDNMETLEMITEILEKINE